MRILWIEISANKFHETFFFLIAYQEPFMDMLMIPWRLSTTMIPSDIHTALSTLIINEYVWLEICETNQDQFI